MSVEPVLRVSRRSFVVSAGVAGAAVAISGMPRRAMAAEGDADLSIVNLMRKQGAVAKITTQSLRGNISVLLGAGGNIAVLDGPDGRLLIDSGLAGSGPNVTRALEAIGQQPIRYLVNTHWHFDHTDGNEWVHGLGAMIVAHENTRKHLSTSQRVDGWRFTFPPAPAGALPVVTLKENATLHFNGTTVGINYYGPAHTDSDVSVTFAEADVIHVGDTWWNGHYPFIDYSTGGSISGTIAAAEANLKKVTDQTIVIPGHGPVGDKTQLTAFRDMLVAVRDVVAGLKKQGKSLQDVVAAKPTAAYDEKWGGFVINPETFIGLVYQGV